MIFKFIIRYIKDVIINFIILIILYCPFYKIACQKGTLKIGLILIFIMAILAVSGIRDRIFSQVCPLLFDPLTPKKYRKDQ